MRSYTRRASKPCTKAPQIHPSHAPKQSPSNDSDAFYQKLNEVWDSFGLGLIINARQTSLDLFLFYSEVTRRGGYHQVCREKKWDELVYALKLEGNKEKLPVQLEMCYAQLLYQYEQLYHYRDPTQKAASIPTLGLLTNCIRSDRKRKYEVRLFEVVDDEDDEVEIGVCNEMTGSEFAEEKMVIYTSPDDKKVKKKRRGLPQGRKTPYQIFLKQECARLRRYKEADDHSNLLHKAVETWRNMTEAEKQPFVEESRKLKESLMEEIRKAQDQNVMAGTDFEDYHVTPQPDGFELIMSEESDAESPLTVDMGSYMPIGA